MTKEEYGLSTVYASTADILVRNVDLPKARIGDVILFHRCGAYSITEGISLFLSRSLPEVYVYEERGGVKKQRGIINTSSINLKI